MSIFSAVCCIVTGVRDPPEQKKSCCSVAISVSNRKIVLHRIWTPLMMAFASVSFSRTYCCTLGSSEVASSAEYSVLTERRGKTRLFSSIVTLLCSTENAASGTMYAIGSLLAKLRDGIGSSARILAPACFISLTPAPNIAASPL